MSKTITVELTVDEIFTIRNALHGYSKSEFGFSPGIQESMYELSCHLYDSIVNDAENNKSGGE